MMMMILMMMMMMTMMMTMMMMMIMLMTMMMMQWNTILREEVAWVTHGCTKRRGRQWNASD